MCTILRVFTKIVYENLSKKFKNSAAILNSTFFFKFLAQCESIYNRCTDDEENDITQKGEQLHQPKFFAKFALTRCLLIEYFLKGSAPLRCFVKLIQKFTLN